MFCYNENLICFSFSMKHTNEIDGTVNVCIDILWRSINVVQYRKGYLASCIFKSWIFLKIAQDKKVTYFDQLISCVLSAMEYIFINHAPHIQTLFNSVHVIALEYIVTYEGENVSLFRICPSVRNAYKGEFNLPTTLQTTTMYRE